jgi:hypothetical protein
VTDEAISSGKKSELDEDTVAMSYNSNVRKVEVEFGKDLVFW